MDRQVEEPLEQQVVVQPLAERPLRAHLYNAIKIVAFNSCTGGTLGRPIREYMASNSSSSSASDLIDDPADLADRVILRDQILGAQRL